MTKPVRGATALLVLAACSLAVTPARQAATSSDPVQAAADSLMGRLRQPTAMVFADSTTKRVMGPLARQYRHSILTRTDRIECPSQQPSASVSQGYVVQVGVDSLVADRAFVHWSIACRVRAGDSYTEWAALELARAGTGWLTIRVLFHFVT
jgi:hypothetical protein